MQQALLTMHFTKEVRIGRKIFDSFTIMQITCVNQDGNTIEIELFGTEHPTLISQPTLDMRKQNANIPT